MAHSHSHSHVHEEYFEANKQHFNETATTYDDHPQAIQLAHKLSTAMRSTYPSIFDEDSTCLMDYACGTGLISRVLCQYTKSIVGVDISHGMVDQFNLRAHNQGLEPEEMRAVCLELKGHEEELDGTKFDVIVCASAYHHFASVEDTTRVLAFFLKPGGTLLVADILQPEDDNEIFPENVHHLVAHKGGFDEIKMREVFEGAKLFDFKFTEATTAKKGGHIVKFFLARGVKPQL